MNACSVNACSWKDEDERAVTGQGVMDYNKMATPTVLQHCALGLGLQQDVYSQVPVQKSATWSQDHLDGAISDHRSGCSGE